MQSTDRYRWLFRRSPSLIVALDKDGYFTDVTLRFGLSHMTYMSTGFGVEPSAAISFVGRLRQMTMVSSAAGTP